MQPRGRAVSRVEEKRGVFDLASLERLSVIPAELAPRLALASHGQLDDAALVAIETFEVEGTAENTVRSYAAGGRYWHAWHLLRYGEKLQLPVPVGTVVQFIVDHIEHWDQPDAKPGTAGRYLLPDWVEDELVRLGFKQKRGPWAVNTIEQRLAALTHMHTNRVGVGGLSLVSPCGDPYITRLLSQIRKTHVKHGRVENKRQAATVDVLKKMLEVCSGNSLREIRDRAILLVGFNAGGRRRGEIADMSMERLKERDFGYSWDLGHTKTKQEGDKLARPIRGSAAVALRSWLNASGISSGPVFREIGLDGRMTGNRMSAQAVYRLVKRLAKLSGQGDVGWGAHSLRSGFITQTGAEQMQLADAMKMSGHSSVAVAMGYYQAGELVNSPVADMAGDIELPTHEGPAEIKSVRGHRKKKVKAEDGS